MRYDLFITEAVRAQLRALDKPTRRNIGFRLELLCDDLQGDVKKLEAANNRYRLRVGNFRVPFTLQGSTIAVYAVKNRKDAYE
jgi:mRNA-degrading endonuclease RelE of RelBE toxin-antitoxin system